MSVEATYILPIRMNAVDAINELSGYLRTLEVTQLIVVDASDADAFDRLDREIGGFTLHIRPSVDGRNGKVRGVLTGLRLASEDRVVVADEDVRYDGRSLREVVRRLDDADVVRPQNFFLPAPWHAVWDSARSLINRAFDGDWPGTLAFRRSAVPKGYNPDVLFENYELVRTIRAGGGKEDVARDLFVARRPPSFQHFIGQRVRQAYDEFARPLRLLIGLAALPLLAACWLRFGTMAMWGFVALTTACAGAGWLRAGAGRYYSALSIAAAPLWALERGICSWLALFERLWFGGVRYSDSIIPDAASSRNERKKWAL
ncbi:MAG: glycosyltransferase family 2 protein [Candidatus Cybelea sp.]